MRKPSTLLGCQLAAHLRFDPCELGAEIVNVFPARAVREGEPVVQLRRYVGVQGSVEKARDDPQAPASGSGKSNLTPGVTQATRLVLRSLARRIQAATREANELEQEILAHVHALAPALLDESGVGPIVAAQLIVAWSHPGRLRSEACFARLAGVAPVPFSSGQTQRHRLSRGGDRQLNRALHTIALHRRHHDPATRDYTERKIADGKSRRDATRLLKRYLARHLYQLLEQQQPQMT